MMGLAAKNAKSAKETWPMVRLGDVCEILDSRRVPITKKDRVAGEIPYYGATGIVDYVSSYIFDERLVLLGEDGARWGANEDSAFIIEGKSWVNNHAHVLRVRDNIADEYLVYYLNFADLNRYITGVTVPKLNQQRMKGIPIPLPPLSVQREIVAWLEKELGEADALAAKFKEIAENADAEFKAELDETFKNVEGEKVRLGDVCEIKNGYTPKASELREAGDVPYFRISAMNFPGNERQMQCPTAWLVGKHRCFRSGSVVFPKNGGAVYTGKVRLLVRDSIVDLNTGVCSPIIDIDCDYLYYWITAYDIRSAIVEGTIPFVDFSKLNDVNFMLPQLTIQHDIVKRLDAAKKRCEKLKAAAERGLRAAEDLRKAILAEAFEQ